MFIIRPYHETVTAMQIINEYHLYDFGTGCDIAVKLYLAFIKYMVEKFFHKLLGQVSNVTMYIYKSSTSWGKLYWTGLIRGWSIVKSDCILHKTL